MTDLLTHLQRQEPLIPRGVSPRTQPGEFPVCGPQTNDARSTLCGCFAKRRISLLWRHARRATRRRHRQDVRAIPTSVKNTQGDNLKPAKNGGKFGVPELGKAPENGGKGASLEFRWRSRRRSSFPGFLPITGDNRQSGGLGTGT